MMQTSDTVRINTKVGVVELRNERAYTFGSELKPFLFKWALRTDAATCFGVHFEERTGVLISHGELEIVRFSAQGSILWRASGEDIFTGAFSLKPGFIEAVDWNGRVYRFDYHDGKEPLIPGQPG